MKSTWNISGWIKAPLKAQVALPHCLLDEVRWVPFVFLQHCMSAGWIKKKIIKKKTKTTMKKKKREKKTTHTGSCAHKWYVHKWTPNTNTLYVHCTPLLLESVKSGRDEKPQTITKVLFCTIYKFFSCLYCTTLQFNNDEWQVTFPTLLPGSIHKWTSGLQWTVCPCLTSQEDYFGMHWVKCNPFGLTNGKTFSSWKSSLFSKTHFFAMTIHLFSIRRRPKCFEYIQRRLMIHTSSVTLVDPLLF